MPEPDGAADRMSWVVSQFSEAQGRFDRNVTPFGERVRKIVGWSHEVLPQLAIAGEIFDLIYVDGDHRAASAYRDCLLAWKLIVAGGIMVIDDYGFMPTLPPEKRPQGGVDAFLKAIRWDYKELHRGYQIVIQARSASII